MSLPLAALAAWSSALVSLLVLDLMDLSLYLLWGIWPFVVAALVQAVNQRPPTA